MKYIVFSLSFFFTALGFAQISGVWKGLLIRDGQKLEQATIIYFDLGANPQTREEQVENDAYAVRVFLMEKDGNFVKGRQGTILKKKEIFGSRWCSLQFDMKYIDSTGYLEGTFLSLECKGNTGRVICFKVNETVPQEASTKELQSWRSIFLDDVKNGRKSKEIRDKERSEFVFQPIYFDYDQAEIRAEYFGFLNRIVYIINSHTDLRIKVTGNTDSDGSDAYNDGLSERRAQAIIDYFVKAGLRRDRIVIEFKGERNPVSDNQTEEGKQKNRRVEFEFI